MKGSKIIESFGTLLAGKLIENAPGIIDKVSQKKEEKSFFEENKGWIFIIILSIFVMKLDYINMFENVILNATINIIFGIIILSLLFSFCYEEKKIFKINISFVKILLVSLIFLGTVNSLYHIGNAIISIFNYIS